MLQDIWNRLDQYISRMSSYELITLTTIRRNSLCQRCHLFETPYFKIIPSQRNFIRGFVNPTFFVF